MQIFDFRPYVRLAKASIALQYHLVRESRLACDAEDRVRYGPPGSDLRSEVGGIGSADVTAAGRAGTGAT